MERATQERLVGAALLIVAGVVTIPWLLDGNNSGAGVTERELVLPGGNDSGNETRRISLEVPRPDSAASDTPVRELNARTVRDVDQPEAAMNLPAPKPQPATTSSAVPSRFAKPMPESKDSDASTKPATDARNTANSPKPAPKPARQESKPPPAVVAKPASQETKPRIEPRPAAVAAVDKAWAVQVGSFASQDNAERLAGLLRGKGYKAFVMRNVIEGRVRFRVRVGPVDDRSEADLLAAALREDRQPARVLSHP